MDRPAVPWGIITACGGWPPSRCSPPSRRPVRYIVGIDVGGTNVVVGVVAEDGSEAVGVVSEPTLPEQGPDAVVERLVTLARASMGKTKGREIAGGGIGSPRPLGTEPGPTPLKTNPGAT